MTKASIADLPGQRGASGGHSSQVSHCTGGKTKSQRHHVENSGQASPLTSFPTAPALPGCGLGSISQLALGFLKVGAIQQASTRGCLLSLS
jgi:hypothetical protein